MLKKKILAVLLALLLLCLTACGSSTDTKDWLTEELGLDDEQLAGTGIEECTDDAILIGNTECEDPLRICIDLPNVDVSGGSWDLEALENFLYLLETTVGLEDVVLEIIPPSYNVIERDGSTTARPAVIERINSEIMDGGGPDVFIAEYQYAVNTETFFVDYDVQNCLFEYPEKAMEYGRFLPLDELIENNTELTEWDKLTQPVLEAGRNEDGQQIIPLSYTFPLLCYPKAEWEYTPDKMYTWNDMLSNPALLPHSLDLANCGKMETYTDMTTSESEVKTEFWSSPDYLEYIMGKFADFDSEELEFTEEELLKCVNDILALEKRDSYEEFDDAREVNVGIQLSERTFNKPMSFLPLYNMDGGITAHIGEFAAVNSNTERPEDAFKVIDLLMSKYVQRWANLYTYVLCQYDAIPMHEELFQESDPLLGNNYYMRQDNYEAFCKVREQITAANFDSEGSEQLRDLLSSCLSEGYLEYYGMTVEDAVHEAYEEMTRRLKE